MMHDINLESPANVDAAKLMSQMPELFRRTVQAEVEASLGLRR
jgi:ubiquitin-protein ligase